MFDGKRFFPDTGMPMRKMACMSRPFALAEPVPLTFASLSAKSLTLITCCWCTVVPRCPCCRDDDVRLLHVPRRRGAALRAQAAVHAHVLVLHHHPPGLGQRARDVERLRR